MPPTSAPYVRVAMHIPVVSASLDGGLYFRPGFKPPPFESQGFQRLPPWLDQVQVCGTLRLEDELPSRVCQVEQQNVIGFVNYEVVKHHVHSLDTVWYGSLHPIEKVNEVTSRAARVSGGQSLSCGWLQGAKDVTLVRSATVIHLLFGTLCRLVVSSISSVRVQELLPRVSTSRQGSHLIQAQHYTRRR
jgi:hypothetical protein